ncbi:MAG: gliding motility-associated C-terminal domain-containing protein, partial [Bacteroidota bacterium]
GTRIVSDKPVAVTNSDDSIINIETTGWDLAGDQLVPVDVLGTEYIVVRGDAASEQVYIVATEDNTAISYFNPIRTQVTLNEGGSTSLNLTGTSTFISSNKPVYVWHLSGVANEPGAALIPPITCTGNQRVNFMRPIDQDFQLILLTRSEHIRDFVLDGNTATQAFSAGAFSDVPGTNNEWKSARINVSSLSLGFHQLENTTGLFHLGTLAFPGAGGGSSYGYFSSYNSLNLGEEETFCEGDTLQLDAGPDALSYEWQDGSAERNFTISGSGIYWVKTRLLGGCELIDTITVEEIQLRVDLGPDSTLCEGETIGLSASNPFASYLWQDGSIGSQYLVDEPGTYRVAISRDECETSDSVTIDYTFFPNLNLGVDTFICEGDNLLLDAGEDSTAWTFTWEDGSTEPERLIDTTGNYSVLLQVENCSLEDEIEVEEIIFILELGEDSTLCEGETLDLNATNPGVSYSWQDNSSSAQYKVESPGTYFVQVQRELCTLADTIQIDYIDVPELDLGPDTLLCEDEEIELNVFFPEASYLWENGSMDPIREVNSAGWFVIRRDYLGCLRSDSLFIIPTIPELSLRPDTLICLSDSVRLFTNPRKATLLWEDGSTANERFVRESGLYTVIATNRCASAQASMSLMVEDCTCQLLLPNVFTPNQDGLHEQFFPELDCEVETYSLEVFDRWGHVLFTSEDPTLGWDGTDTQGNALKEGVYFYQLLYRGADRWNQQNIRRKGNVLLVR